MKNITLLLFILLSVYFVRAQTYTMNWSSSFSPAWSSGNTSGTASNIGGSGVSMSVSMVKSGGSFSRSGGTTGPETPTVSGSTFLVGGSLSNLEVAIDYTNHGEHTDIMLQFSQAVTSLAFSIADIDKPSTTSNEYIDEVIVSGSDGLATRLPALSRYDPVSDPDFLVIAGNTAHANPASGKGGNSASSMLDQRGTIKADFGSMSIVSVTIRYKNNSSAQHDPATQAIAVGNLSFQKVVPVPVVFTYIRASAEPHQNVLSWQTANEVRNNHFEIEKSGHSQLWSKIGQVPGAGTSSDLKNYSFTDRSVHGGTVHYRIRQVDQDGKSTYSTILVVTRTHQHWVAEVYPNPVQASSIISLYADREDEMMVTLLDAAGRVLDRDEWLIGKGSNELSLPSFARLPKGHYVLQLHGLGSKYHKVIKLVKH